MIAWSSRPPNRVGSSKVFASSVIRKLARSEEMFAEAHNFVGLGAHLKGHVEIDALSAALTRCSRRTPFSAAA